jgi:hypothetical protein
MERLKDGRMETRKQGARELKCKNGKIERWKNGNRKQGALKAQLHLARGETPGHVTSPTNSAPCKGNYIKIERCKHGNMELNRLDLRLDL